MSDFTTYEVHGSRFDSYIGPARGSDQLCAWRLTVPAGLVGVPHRPDHDEVILVLSGSLTIRLDGVDRVVAAGDVVLVTADTEIAVGGGVEGGSGWVTTTPGLRAVMRDGTVLEPPWAR